MTVSSVYSKPEADKAGTLYSISGFDFLKLKFPKCEHMDHEHPCLNVLVGKEPLQAGDQFTIYSDSSATAFLTSATLAKGKAKALRLQVSGGNSSEDKIEWALALPKADEPKAVPSPSFLRAGDTGKVSFPGANLAKVDTVFFDGQVLSTCGNTPTSGCRYNSEAASLEITIPTTVTRLPGRKEFTAVVAGKVVTQLSIEVTRR